MYLCASDGWFPQSLQTSTVCIKLYWIGRRLNNNVLQHLALPDLLITDYHKTSHCHSLIGPLRSLCC